MRLFLKQCVILMATLIHLKNLWVSVESWDFTTQRLLKVSSEKKPHFVEQMVLLIMQQETEDLILQEGVVVLVDRQTLVNLSHL